MSKFTPNIVIWNITIFSKEDMDVLANYYFLSYKRANKFFEKHIAEWSNDYKVVLGGETLWLWDLK